MKYLVFYEKALKEMQHNEISSEKSVKMSKRHYGIKIIMNEEFMHQSRKAVTPRKPAFNLYVTLIDVQTDNLAK